MRPTRRGWVVVVAVAAAFGSAVAFGPRGLNAIVAPGVVAIVAAAWQLRRFEPPSLSREHPPRGEQGGTARIRLTFDTDTPRSAHVVEAVGGAAALDRSRTIASTTLAYEVDLPDRGELQVGPTTVTVRDVLGLLKRTFDYPETGSILVHPPVRQLPGPVRAALVEVHGGPGDERQAVEGIRRYQRGDPLRDVHWKKSAAQADRELVVKRFSAEGGSRTVSIVAEADPGETDAMAGVAASVAVTLIEAGVSVALETPSGRVDPDAAGRRAVLDHLARVGPGQVHARTRREADVTVHATSDGVSVSVGGRRVDVPAGARGVDPTREAVPT